ncbi:hypothetical protein TEA_024465 [Camellia sinensis var. sinensis]|uniref:Uncharacterized protein n=1 Tax=Camellia sinensis var. sinensis TaxID=542762 RepID=A0A4S4DYQ1_CAMSN|nr:hypothetical protein TEA_024465 [Camellia sinensis var. sinensis]
MDVDRPGESRSRSRSWMEVDRRERERDLRWSTEWRSTGDSTGSKTRIHEDNVYASTKKPSLSGYIKDFQVHDPQRVGKITVELQGRINGCRALMYRQDIKAQDIEKYRFHKLPTHQWGYIVITTPNGVLDHEEAIRQNVGGQVLGYFY